AHLLAWCLLQLGNYTEGVRVAKDSQERFAPTVFGTSVLFRGLAALNQLGDLDKPITVLESLYAQSLALQFRGAAAALRGDYDSAASIFRRIMLSEDVKEASRATTELVNLEADQGSTPQDLQLLATGLRTDLKTGEDGFASQKTAAQAFLEGVSGNRERAAAR